MQTKQHLYDKRLEGLRGICAMVVFWGHIIGFSLFGTKGNSTVDVLLHLQFSSQAVLIFFIISGYVMGINHIDTPFTFVNVKTYLLKRIIRLYPIYFSALIISAALFYSAVNWRQLLGHMFFLQEFLVDTITSNRPLWSLSFEFLFYLLFIPVWAFNKFSKNFYLVISAIVIIAAAVFGHDNNCIRALLIGWVFWLAGLYIARLNKNTDAIQRSKPWLTYLLLILATVQLQAGGFYMRLLHLHFDEITHILINDIAFLPVCSLIILQITGRHFSYQIRLKLIVYLIPAIEIASLFYFKHDIRSNDGWIWGIAFFGLAVVLTPLRTNNWIFEKMAGIGKISFAIYIFHFPICIFLNSQLSGRLSGPVLIFTGLALTTGIVFVLAYYAEIVIQPRIRSFFLKPKQAKQYQTAQ